MTSLASLRDLAKMYYLARNWTEAEPVHRQIVELEPENPIGHYNLGVVLYGLHHFEAAIECYHRALQLLPNFPEAISNIGLIRKELGDTPQPYFHAVLMACFAFFALALDTLFLAPTMDILNIANLMLQYLAAMGFAALCTGYFELTGLLYIGAKDSLPKRLMAAAAGCVGALSLIVWGVLRGYQLGFGNCRKTDGRMVAVPREQCVAMAGTVELPFERGIPPRQYTEH